MLFDEIEELVPILRLHQEIAIEPRLTARVAERHGDDLLGLPDPNGSQGSNVAFCTGRAGTLKPEHRHPGSMRGGQADPVDATEIEFEVQDRRCLLVTASDRLSCRIELKDMVQRSDGSLLEYFLIEGAPTDAVLEAADAWSATARARLVREVPDGGVFEFVVTGPCVASTLADVHAIPRSVTAEDGASRVTALVPGHTDAKTVLSTFQARHPQSRLVARRELALPGPLVSQQGFRNALLDGLTDHQLEALKTAYAQGYFARPRESTAAECAEVLGVSQSTFSQHIQEAQRKLMGSLLEPPASTP